MKKEIKIYPYFKRLFDFIISFACLAILLVPLLLISAVIKIESKGPVIFKQKRVGKNGSTFYIYKFRTMSVDAPNDSATDLLTNADSWITNVGGFLRKTSLDEIPQLVNILKGQMSLVGPRPALWNQHNLNKIREEHNIHDILPGLTGLAQISGRDENNDEEKCKYDYIYLQNMSFKTDILIIFKTFLSVFKSEGVIEGGKRQ